MKRSINVTGNTIKAMIEPLKGFPDIHTHILPGMDDGCCDEQEAVEVLRQCVMQHTSVVVLTPHFYAWENSPEGFLSRRDASLRRLLDAVHGVQLPHMALGAEVAYFSGISHCADLPSLCIEGTDLLLLEMPFSAWTDRIFTELREIRSHFGLRIIIAHIDRYLKLQSSSVLARLFGDKLLFQINASYLSGRRTAGRAAKMIRSDRLQFIGSDCHDASSRVPDIDVALFRLAQLMPEEEISIWRDHMLSLLEGVEIV